LRDPQPTKLQTTQSMFGFFFKTQTSQYSQMLHHRQSPLFHKVPSPSIPQGPNHLNPQAYPQAPQGTPLPLTKPHQKNSTRVLVTLPAKPKTWRSFCTKAKMRLTVYENNYAYSDHSISLNLQQQSIPMTTRQRQHKLENKSHGVNGAEQFVSADFVNKKTDKAMTQDDEGRRASPFPDEWISAAEWWSQRLTFIGGFMSGSSPQSSYDATMSPSVSSFNTPIRLGNSFKTSLLAEISRKFADHWYPDSPIRGSAFRSISFSTRLDPLLKKAGESVGLQVRDLQLQTIDDLLMLSRVSQNVEKMLLSARNCTMFVNPGEVIVRQGKDNVFVVFKSEGMPQASSAPQDSTSEKPSTKSLDDEQFAEQLAAQFNSLNVSGERSDIQSCKDSTSAGSGTASTAINSRALMSI
jgi:hypothetical protein